MKATWNRLTLAESNETVMVEGNHHSSSENVHDGPERTRARMLK